MANRFWNPATDANWADSNVWALTDGGTPNQAKPTSSDDVFFSNTNFILTGNLSDTANYKNEDDLISCRVWQLAI